MVCIIATNVAPRELIVATEQVDLLRHGRPFVFTTESLGCNDGENPRMAPRSQLPPKFPLRPSSANRFPDRIVFLSRDDRFLSRDRWRGELVPLGLTSRRPHSFRTKGITLPS